METNIKKLPKSKVEIEVKIPSKEFDKFIEKATKKLGENLEVKGFRKGKVPKDVIKDKVGQDAILQEAADMAVKENYSKIVSENKIEPITQPNVEILKMAEGNPFEFKIKTEVLPEIKLPDHKKIASKIEAKKVSVSKKDLEDSLKWLQKSRAKFSALERPAKKDDFVEIEYQSPQIKDSQKINDGFVLGEGHFIPGFEDKIIGMKSGEEKEFSLTFPEKFQRKSLAGKEANFKVKVKAVKKRELPEINDEFASSLGSFDNLAALKENIKKGLTEEKERKEQQRKRAEILDKIAQKTKMEIPQNLIDFEKKRMLKNLKQQVGQNLQLSFEDYLKSVDKTEEELKNSLGREAQKRVRNFLILKQIGKEEGVSVTDKEIEERMNEDLKKYPPEKKEELDIAKLKKYTKGAIYNEKVLQKLEELSK